MIGWGRRCRGVSGHSGCPGLHPRAPHGEKSRVTFLFYTYGLAAYESRSRDPQSRFPSPSIPHIASTMPANTTTDAAAFSNKSHDILIVGGGTAGLALAAR